MEIHGWAVIRESFTFDDDDVDDATLDAVVRDIESRLDHSDGNVRTDLSYLNGTPVLQVALDKNHYTPASDEVIALFEYVARVAPGSYGLLHVYDDDGSYGDRNSLHVLVLARGRVVRRVDPFLTPIQPRVEDPSPDDTLETLLPKYLPLGSVVTLREGEKKLMVFGRHQQDTAGDRVFDYAGVPYPEGNVGPRATFLFDHDAIAEIHYLGYADEEEAAWSAKLGSLPDS